MPRSSHTLRLSSAAHSLGDDYYRRLTISNRTETSADPELVKLANAYKDALEELRAHIDTLVDGEETAALQVSTKRFIELVNRDLERFNGNHTDGHHTDGDDPRKKR
jgi:hypothetical protein